VGEAVTGAGHLDEQAGEGGLLQRGEEVVFRHARGPLDHGRLELQPDHRRGRQHPIGRLGQARQPPADDVPYPLGDTEVSDVGVQDPPAFPLFDGPRLGEVAHDLGHEERVAFRLPPHHPGQLLGLLIIEAVAGGGLDEGGDPGGVEARECQPLHSAVATELPQEVAHGVAAADVAVAVGDDDQEPQGFLGTQDVPQQQQRGLGRPMEIVEDQEDGRFRGNVR
jgi:hypothetical protein